MTAPDWPTLYADTIERYGGALPTNTLATDLLHHYETHPQAITKILDRVAASYEAGRINSPWGVVKSELDKLTTHPPSKPNPDRERARAIERAEQLIRNTGHEIPTADELHDELFGDRGPLRTHRTPQLEQRLTQLWETTQPNDQEQAA